MRPLLIVAGPTASGKSHLAIHMAELHGGELINCDSMQLYRGFNIGTAKTPTRERQGIPHHLFDVLEPQMISSAGEYARLARKVLAEVSERGAIPMLVGGTGFYLRALIDGLPALPPRDAALRQALVELEQVRPGSLHEGLARRDPVAAARIQRTDVQKLVRALEICMLTDGTLPASSEAAPLEGYRVLQLALDPPRDQLAEAIAKRTKRMFAEGLIEEVRELLAGGCTGEEKPFESVGYKQALAHLRGQLPIEEAIEATTIATRQYAKRQRTWFRRDTRIQWLSGFGTDENVRREAEALYGAVGRLGD